VSILLKVTRGNRTGRAALLAACAALLTVAAAAAPPALAEAPAAQGGAQLGGHGIVVNYPAHGARKLPRVPADAYVIADATTGQVLAAKDPHRHLAPASTLKILTTDTLMPALNPDQSVVISKFAADVEPSKVGLIQGRSYQVHDLFKALLLISANDAAIALAQATGSYGKAVAMMNAEAHHLQADETVARTPNGLPAKGQYSSAYDLALFARQALTMPQFLKIEAMRVTTFPLHARHSVKLWNQNLMLGSFPGDIGGKIGWTTASEATFIGWARRGGHTLIVTIMHCIPLTEMIYAAKLLTWGFAMDGHVRPVGVLVPPLATRAAAHQPAPAHSAAPTQAAPTRAAAHRGAGKATATSAPAVPVVAIAGLVVALVLVAVRRPRRGGNPPGP
jgi:serine-type D-Ala-D-Ala carboxypeptidase (penicillin-binding protein 5/6)